MFIVEILVVVAAIVVLCITQFSLYKYDLAFRIVCLLSKYGRSDMDFNYILNHLDLWSIDE